MQELPKASTNPIHQNLSQVSNIVAVSSGKGGVGKSTVSVNLAMALKDLGYQVGLMDGDVYGPSVPKMLSQWTPPKEEDGKLIPQEKLGISFMSMGLLTNEDTPVIWRGPMATKLIQTFLSQVKWGKLDYLIVDLPPGTGDVQLTLTQLTPLTGAVVVTTPQEVAVSVTMRGIKMFDEVKVPVLGVIENMSGFVCGHCGEHTSIFRQGGGEKTAKELGLPFLGRIPLSPEITMAGDLGQPLNQSHDDDRQGVCEVFKRIAQNLLKQVDHVKTHTLSTNVKLEKFQSDDLGLTFFWSDSTQSRFRAKALRMACACASCVDEMSGKILIHDSQVPSNITVKSIKPVGHYGVQIAFSDGHSTGIYTINRLRELV